VLTRDEQAGNCQVANTARSGHGILDRLTDHDE